MMWPSRSVAIEYSNELPGWKASGSAPSFVQHLVRAHGVDAVDAELAVAVAQRVLRKEEIGEAGAMGHQVVNVGWARGGDRSGLARDLEVLELRQVGGDRRHQRDLVLLEQPQRRDRGDELGRRRDRMDRVELHRDLLVLVGPAHGLVQHDLAVLGNEHDGARNAAALDVRLEPIDDAGELCLLEAGAQLRDRRGRSLSE